MDTLSTISSQGDVITTAQLIDEGNRMELPVEVFDGELLSEPLRQLEEQWQAVLGEPIRSVSEITHWRVEMAHRQLYLCNQRIEHFNRLIERLEWLRQQAEKALYTESRRVSLVRRYDTMLRQYSDFVERAQTSRYAIQQKLNQLVY